MDKHIFGRIGDIAVILEIAVQGLSELTVVVAVIFQQGADTGLEKIAQHRFVHMFIEQPKDRQIVHEGHKGTQLHRAHQPHTTLGAAVTLTYLPQIRDLLPHHHQYLMVFGILGDSVGQILRRLTHLNGLSLRCRPQTDKDHQLGTSGQRDGA